MNKPGFYEIPGIQARQCVRAAILRALVGPDHYETYADGRWPGCDPEAIVKAAESALTSDFTGAGIGTRIAFAESVRMSSVLRLPLYKVAFGVRFLLFSPTTRARWAREGRAIPMDKPDLAGSSLMPCRIGVISLATREAIASTALEPALEAELRTAVADAIDEAFFSDYAGDTDTPAGIFAASPATEIASTGNIADDLQAAFASYTGDPRRAALVMSPAVAVHLGATVPAAIDLGPAGGTLAGMQVVTSNASVLSGDSNGPSIVLLDPGFIAAAIDQVMLDATDRATLEADNAPTGSSAVPTPTQQVSLFQTNTVGIKATALANWQLMRPGSIVRITNIAY